MKRSSNEGYHRTFERMIRMEKMAQTEIVEEINSLNEKLSRFQQQGVDIDEIQELMDMLEESISLSQVLFFQYVYKEDGE